MIGCKLFKIIKKFLFICYCFSDFNNLEKKLFGKEVFVFRYVVLIILKKIDIIIKIKMLNCIIFLKNFIF